MNRRNFMTKAIEYASAIPLVGLLAKNYLANKSYHVPNISRAISVEKTPEGETAQKFLSAQRALHTGLDDLCNQYKSEYYRSHTRVKTSMVNGKPKTSIETYWVWEEPANVPKHSVVYGWRDEAAETLSRAQALFSGQKVDLNRLEHISIERENVGKASQIASATALYSAGIAGLMLYEEAFASFRGNKVEEVNSPQQITRRSFFKVAAALAGGVVANKVENVNTSRDEEGKRVIKNAIAYAPKIAGEPSEKSFNRYFGTSPAQLMARTKGYFDTSAQTLSDDIKSTKVANSFRSVMRQSREHHQALEEIFIDGIPYEMGDLVKRTQITQDLAALQKGEQSRALGGIFLEGLAVGGTMAAILIPAEVVNSKFE